MFNFTLAILAIPPRPSDDDFYDAPENLASYKEGEIMKWRDTPQKIRSLLYPINIQGAWQFMVRSTNSKGKPVGIVGTILKPYNADPRKILGYNYFQDSVNANCAPSYSILFGANQETIGSQLESFYMNAALTKGWYVLITDYEGPNAAFTAGKLAGMATLDGIRAALKSGKNTGISRGAKVALWGYSGGTIPLAWAASLQPSYAPELSKNLIGVAVGGWVTDIKLVVENIDGTPYAGFVGSGMLGLASEYPEIQSQIFDRMHSLKVDKVKTLYNQCMVGALTNFVGTNFFTGSSPVFKQGQGFLRIPEVKNAIDENILDLNQSGPIPNIPFFVYHGQADQVIPFENSQKVYDSWCSRGMGSMEFAVSKTSGHFNEWLDGGGAAFGWLAKRFNGEDPVSGCTRTVRKSNLDYPGASQGFSTFTRTKIAAVFQKQLGPLLKIGGSNSIIRNSIYNIITWLIKSLRWVLLKRGFNDNDDLSQLIEH